MSLRECLSRLTQPTTASASCRSGESLENFTSPHHTNPPQVGCKSLFSDIGKVHELDVLELVDVEVGTKLTSPLWECGDVLSKTVGEGRHVVSLSVLDVEFVEVKTSGHRGLKMCNCCSGGGCGVVQHAVVTALQTKRI